MKIIKITPEETFAIELIEDGNVSANMEVNLKDFQISKHSQPSEGILINAKFTATPPEPDPITYNSIVNDVYVEIMRNPKMKSKFNRYMAEFEQLSVKDKKKFGNHYFPYAMQELSKAK